MRRGIILLAVSGALFGCGGSQAIATGGAPNLRISGNHFVANGQTTRLLGVNITGPEFVCRGPLWESYYRNGVFAYPVNDAAVAAMAGWHINAVRVPLNEHCWLGINAIHQGADPTPGNEKVTPFNGAAGRAKARRDGAKYRAAIKALVRRLHRHGLYAILDLHWTQPGSGIADGQDPFPNLSHSPAFWKSVASAFKNDHSTVFELFNEPMLADDNGTDHLSWSCWQRACTLPLRCADCDDKTAHGSYRTANFQLLVNTVRRTGARNPVLVPGRWYSNDLSQWLRRMPRDPIHQLGATFHGYQLPPCHDISCWDDTIKSVAARVPVTTTEYGANDGTEPCQANIDYDNALMDWADGAGVGYTAWVWWDLTGEFDDPPPKCSLGLNVGYDGTARVGHGQAVKDHFAALSAQQGGGPVH
jgi:hypothetical protein